MMPRKKVSDAVVIERCAHCPHYQNDPKHFAEAKCVYSVKTVFNPGDIPDWCELEDYKGIKYDELEVRALADMGKRAREILSMIGEREYKGFVHDYYSEGEHDPAATITLLCLKYMHICVEQATDAELQNLQTGYAMLQRIIEHREVAVTREVMRRLQDGHESD